MKLSKIILIVCYVVIIAFVLGVFGVFVGFVNNGQKSFYLQYGETQLYNDVEHYEFNHNTYYYFNVKNSLGFTDEQINGIDYSIKVVLDPTKLLSHGYTSYICDDHFYSFSEEIDCTDYFIVNQEGNSFVFRLASELTLSTILENYHSSSALSEVPDVELYSDNYFVLIVTNNADNTTICLGITEEVTND